MGKRSKILIICGAAAIGVITLLIVMLSLVASGALSLTQKKIVFVSQSAEFVYDGQTHTCDEWYIAEGELDDGHTATVNVTGSITDVGTVPNSFYVTIYDSSDVDVTDYYDIECSEGSLVVTGVAITAESESAYKIYDGTPLTCNEYSIYGGVLSQGDYLEAAFSASLTQVGIKQNYFVLTVYDSDGNDKTSCYNITYIYGELAVYYGELEIYTPSAEKTYDGTPLTSQEWRLISGGVASGHALDVAMPQSITNAGTAENTPYVVITDQSGSIVTEYYRITYDTGTLTVLPYTLKLYTASDAKQYDGTALVNYGWGITSANGAVSGDNISINVYGSQTDAGQSENYADVAITNSSGTDVTNNYDVQITYGTLIVTAINVTIISGSATKQFDGTPLTCSDYAVTPADCFVSGQYLTVDITGSRTYKGESENTISNVAVYSTNANGTVTDVTQNYNITLQCGELVITGDIEYYATDLFVGDNYLEEGNLYTFTAQQNGIYTFTGGSFTLYDSTGNEISGDGVKLEARQSVTVGADENFTLNISAVYSLDEGNNCLYEGEEYYYEAEYDGMYSFTVIGDGAVGYTDVNGNQMYISSGETLELEISAGASIQFFPDGDVTLVIGIDSEDANASGGGSGSGSGSDSGSGGGDGGEGGDGGSGSGGTSLDTSGNIAGGSGSGDGSSNAEVLKIYAEQTGTLYLKLISYGDYQGTAWEQTAAYSALLDDTYGMDYLCGTALENSGYSAVYFEIDSSTSDYLLPYYLATGQNYLIDYDVQISDVYYTGSSSSYSGYAYFYDYLSYGAAAQSAAYSYEEQAYREYVYENYTYVGADSTAAFLQDIINAQGFDTSDVYTLISQVVSYVQNAATYNLDYDSALDDEEDKVVAFLSEYKEGICQHFATAATLLLRALGLPARYTGGYVAPAVAGEWTTVTAAYAHAWTEVYIDCLGWVKVDATPGGVAGGADLSGTSGGGNQGEGGELSIKPVNEYYLYDTETHSYSSAMLQGLTDLTNMGYTYEFTVEGERSILGVTQTTITSFTLYNPDGEDVTSYFDIEYLQGKLQVYAVQLNVSTGSASAQYSGQALTCSDISYDSYKIIDGHSIEIYATGSLTHAGEIINSFYIQICDENGNDVTGWYYVVPDYGTLTVTPLEITVTASSASKAYDGTALTCEEYIVQGLPEGFTAEVVINGSQTKIGYSSNIIKSVKIYDGEGNDVTSDFNINTVSGTLTVTVK